MILECIVTTLGPDGTLNIAPMGPIVEPGSLDRFVLRPYTSSTTYRNLKALGEGVLHITDGTYALFESEYHVPLLPPVVAAHAATYAEHLFSILLVLGLFTRLSALAFLGMTAVIEIFVYPDAWPTHLSWAAPLIYLVARGGGRFSLDRALRLD